MAMDLSLKRPSTPEPACHKRRKISLEEVEDELSMAGIAQPALSLLQGSNLGVKRELEIDIPEGPVTKRARPSSQLLPFQTVDGQGVTLSREIVPFRGANLSNLVPSYPAAFTTQQPDIRNLCGRSGSGKIAVNPAGVAFIITENGMMLAQFPNEWRPRIVLADGRIVEVTLFALDRRGTVYIWSQDGQFVAEMQAARLLRQDGVPAIVEEPAIRLMSTKDKSDSDLKLMLNDLVCSPLTPTTNVPESDTETEWAADIAMETD